MKKYKVGQNIKVLEGSNIVLKGKISSVDYSTKSLQVLLPDGTTKTIDWLKFIVITIPLIEQIVDFLFRTFKRFKRLK